VSETLHRSSHVQDDLFPLFVDGCHSAEASALLAPANFADQAAACACLQRIARHSGAAQALATMLPTFLSALGAAAAPDGVLVNFERFADNVADPAALFQHLTANPRAGERLQWDQLA